MQNSLPLSPLPRCTLLLPSPDPQFLQQHIPPIRTRTIPAAHAPTLFQETTQTPCRGSTRVNIIRHWMPPPLQLLHLSHHSRLRPFLAISTRNDRLVREQFLELATDDGGVVVAGDFACDFVERDGAPVAMRICGGFADMGVGVDVFFIYGGFGLGFGVGLCAMCGGLGAIWAG